MKISAIKNKNDHLARVMIVQNFELSRAFQEWMADMKICIFDGGQNYDKISSVVP